MLPGPLMYYVGPIKKVRQNSIGFYYTSPGQFSHSFFMIRLHSAFIRSAESSLQGCRKRGGTVLPNEVKVAVWDLSQIFQKWKKNLVKADIKQLSQKKIWEVWMKIERVQTIPRHVLGLSNKICTLAKVIHPRYDKDLKEGDPDQCSNWFLAD